MSSDARRHYSTCRIRCRGAREQLTLSSRQRALRADGETSELRSGAAFACVVLLLLLCPPFLANREDDGPHRDSDDGYQRSHEKYEPARETISLVQPPREADGRGHEQQGFGDLHDDVC